MFDTSPINGLNALMRNSGFKHCTWHHEFSTDELKRYKDYIEHCEDCQSPLLWSCCNDELDPDPSAGGWCVTCGEHCL